MIDANIIAGLKPFQVESPVDNYSKMMTLQNLMYKNQEGQMKMDDHQQTQASDRTLAQLMAQGRTPADIATGLASAGYGKQSMAYTKAQQDTAEGQAKIGHFNAQTGKLGAETLNLQIQRHKDQLGPVNDVAGAAAWVTAGFNNPQFADLVKSSGRTLDQAIAAIPQDAAGFAQWKMQSSLGADKLIQMTRPDANAQLSAQTSIATNAATNLTSLDNNRATVGATVRGQNMTDARSRDTNAQTQSKPFEVTGPEGTPVLVRQDKQGNISRVEGFGPKDGNGKLTEDQGKATGWLIQAENAFSNMKGAMERTPSSAKPGINDAISVIPMIGGIANTMRGADRQQFMQGASSLSEALLRAATGAGVNRDEAEQKRKELTPVFGEDAKTTKQKMAAIPLYIESLKVRAGPGAKKAAVVLQESAPNVDSLLDKYK